MACGGELNTASIALQQGLEGGVHSGPVVNQEARALETQEIPFGARTVTLCGFSGEELGVGSQTPELPQLQSRTDCVGPLTLRRNGGLMVKVLAIGGRGNEAVGKRHVNPGKK